MYYYFSTAPDTDGFNLSGALNNSDYFPRWTRESLAGKPAGPHFIPHRDIRLTRESFNHRYHGENTFSRRLFENFNPGKEILFPGIRVKLNAPPPFFSFVNFKMNLRVWGREGVKRNSRFLHARRLPGF